MSNGGSTVGRMQQTVSKRFRRMMNTDTYKFRFDITVHRFEFEKGDLSLIPNPDDIVCEISRKTRHIVVTNPANTVVTRVVAADERSSKDCCVVTWEQTLSLNGTLALQDRVFLPKEYAFKVRMLEDGHNTITTLAKTKMDLSQFCSMSQETFEVGLPIFGSHPGVLQMTLTANWLKNANKKNSTSASSMTSFGSLHSIDSVADDVATQRVLHAVDARIHHVPANIPTTIENRTGDALDAMEASGGMFAQGADESMLPGMIPSSTIICTSSGNKGDEVLTKSVINGSSQIESIAEEKYHMGDESPPSKRPFHSLLIGRLFPFQCVQNC